MRLSSAPPPNMPPRSPPPLPPTRWTITYAQTGSDDDEPAEIRVTETRNGAALTSVKEVRPVGATTPWLFRNETRLRRVGD